MTKTKFTITQAHRITGAARNTIKNYITDPKSEIRLTAEKNNKGHFLIDASELMRVFGNDLDFDAVAGTKSTLKDAVNGDQLTTADRQNDINAVLKQLEEAKAQWERERIELIRDKERLHHVIENMQKEHADSMRLLEHHGKDKHWKEEFDKLSAQVTNQEEEIEKEKTRNRRILKALHEERTKPFFKKLFGGSGSRGIARKELV